MRRLREQRGFTVIEVVIAMTILLVLMGAVFSVVDTSARSERAQHARRVALEDLRTAMNRMTKDIRQALDVSTSSTPSKLVMTTLVGGSEYTVTYEVTGGELRRTVDASTPEPMVDGFTSGNIFCYDPPDCVLAAPAASGLTIIGISATVEPDAFANGAVVTLATDVQLRNS